MARKRALAMNLGLLFQSNFKFNGMEIILKDHYCFHLFEFFIRTTWNIHTTVHRDAFCQFLFWWIYYCHNSKSTGKETDKTHLCAVVKPNYFKYICSNFLQPWLSCLLAGSKIYRAILALENSIFLAWMICLHDSWKNILFLD